MKKFSKDRLDLSKLKNKKKRIKDKREKLRDVSIKKKFLRSFYIISIVGCISGVLGLIFLHTMSKEYNKALINYGIAQGDIGKLGIEIERTNSSLRDFIFLSGDDRNEAKAEFNEALDNIDIYLNSIENYMINDDEIDTLKDIRRVLERYKELRSSVAATIIGNKQEEGLRIFREQGAPLMEEISDKISSLLQGKIDQCNLLTNKLNTLKNINSILVIITIVGTFILSITIANKLSRMLSDNISKIKDCVEEMANGNLDVVIDVDSKDEIGMLAHSFSEMVDRLKAYINEISYVLGNIAHGNLVVSTKEIYQHKVQKQ